MSALNVVDLGVLLKIDDICQLDRYVQSSKVVAIVVDLTAVDDKQEVLQSSNYSARTDPGSRHTNQLSDHLSGLQE